MLTTPPLPVSFPLNRNSFAFDHSFANPLILFSRNLSINSISTKKKKYILYISFKSILLILQFSQTNLILWARSCVGFRLKEKLLPYDTKHGTN